MESSEFQLAELSKAFEDPAAVRKRQKAGREKKRRDQLNDQFSQLGNVLDADRPRNDKTTILNDTIQLLKELTAEVDKLKAEHAALSEESQELAQEKNDLRDEKATLKSDVERLNVQCQQRVGPTFPWAAPDSLVPPQPSYPYPMPIAFPPPTAFPMHPYHYFSSPNPGMYQNPCPYMPYMTPNPPAEQLSTQHVCPSARPSSRTEVSGGRDVRNSLAGETEQQIDKTGDSDVVATDLELKTFGSTTVEDNTSPGEQRSRKALENKDVGTKGSSSSKSSSHSIQDSSSDSVAGGGKTND
ncbi:hypothetical protein RND81_14G215200 [Saponaria officinalis]|uniref:BHLH domain-containing protein n=1 Tax=Saponaria officinalis TaxID=3572 RepID=A0AAW1GQ02_SAPOF